MTHPLIILASTSKIRHRMLQAAGLVFTVETPDIDEAALQNKMRDSMVPAETMATTLAQAKALSITHKQPDRLVIGADQVLYYQGKILTKAQNRGQARENLQILQSKAHNLVSAVCVSYKDRVIWSHAERARLTMRALDDKAIDRYCDLAGEALTECVGGYQLEGLGSWLFENVEGDYFTILGLPLLPLQHFLRTQGYEL